MRGKCELCKRENVELTEHHLIPKEYGGKDICMLCIPCHKQIHALYSNKELLCKFYTIERLIEDYNIQKFLKWIQKQDVDKKINVKQSKRKKNTRY